MIRSMSEDWTTGRALYQAERYEEAIPYLERAASAPEVNVLGGGRGPALNYLGMAQYVLGRFDEAVATFRAAILQTPGKARLHYNLGNSLLAVGRTADARRQYELALDLEPDYAEARQALVVAAAESAVPAAEPLPPSPAPTIETPPSGLLEARLRIESLEAQAREAREATAAARARLAEQEGAERELVDELLAAVRDYARLREEEQQEAALKQARALLQEALQRSQSAAE